MKEEFGVGNRFCGCLFYPYSRKHQSIQTRVVYSGCYVDSRPIRVYSRASAEPKGKNICEPARLVNHILCFNKIFECMDFPALRVS